MSKIIESLTSMITPEMLGAIARTFGVDTPAVQTAVSAAGPVLLGSMTRTASHAGGAERLLRMLPEERDGILGSLGNIGNVLGGLLNVGGSGGMLTSLLGPGVNSVSATISRASGFNVAPLLGMLAPAMLGVIGRTARHANLDGAGLASLLAKEHAEWAADPAHGHAVTLATAAMDAGDHATALITAYGESWQQVLVGPAAVLYLIASADMSGPVGSVREARAANDALVKIANAAEPTSLIAAAFAAGITRDHLSALKSMAPHKEALLQTITTAIAAVRMHSPEQSRAYNDLLFGVATAAATAAKEGGFLGLGGTLVSTDEQVALDTLKAVIA